MKNDVMRNLIVCVMLLVVLGANAVPVINGNNTKSSTLNSEKKNVAAQFEVVSHPATREDIDAMKQRCGVFDPTKNYNVLYDGHGTGLAPPTEEGYALLIGSLQIVDHITSKQSFRGSFDLSIDPCFPQVGNQWSQGSCAAWAATYYATGYVQAKLHNWNQAYTGYTYHLLSPAWTYNKCNGGSDQGSNSYGNMYVSQSVGVCRMSRMVYNQYDCTNWGNESAWRDAPLYRVKTIYSAPKDIDAIKALLVSGYPVTFALDAASYNYFGGDGVLGSTAMQYSINHANTVVGYDDSKTDVQTGEVGAFKIVNSWGNTWGPFGNGYYWITYQAFLGSWNWHGMNYVDALYTDSSPKLLGRWTQNPQGDRSADVELGIGPHNNPLETREPYLYGGTSAFPSFMCLDITELYDKWVTNVTSFYLDIGYGIASGTITSFKIEYYEYTYVPGNPSNISPESPDTPRNTPCYVTTNLTLIDHVKPKWRNQGESKAGILRGESVSLYAQGEDNTVLRWATLSTKETGAWQNVSGQYGSPMYLTGVPDQWIWTNFTWQNQGIQQGRRIGWKIYYKDILGNVNVTNIVSFVILSNPVVTDLTSIVAYTGDPFTFNASAVDDQGIAAAFVEYWYGGGTHTNVSMMPAGGSYYTRTITIPAHSLDVLHYIISAKDTLNYWSNTGEKQVVILDNDNPEWRSQGQSNAMVAPGGSVSLYAQGYDNVALNWAWLATNETGEWLTFSGRGWWNLDWRYSKQITIDHTKVSADLTNFPVLISITSSDFITHAQPDGDDFVFIDSTNTTKYNHEIEYYNSANGELVAWVNIPLLSSTQDTILNLYYCNPTCTNQQNVQGTWDANYLMVHNLTGASSSALRDSTSHHWDVTRAFGNPGYNYPGKAGKAVDLDPAGGWDSLRIGGFNLPTNSTYTGSAWIYVDGNPTSIRYVFEGNNSRGISLVVNSDKKVYANANTNNGLRSTHGETIVDAANPQWIYVCTRADTLADRLDVFVNGVSENHTALNGTIVPVNFGLNVGASQSNTSRMNGRIDELRISNIPRTDAWIHTEYNMMSSPSSFMIIGSERMKDGGSKYGSPLYMNGVYDQWAWSNFTWQNSSIPEGTRVGWRIYYVDTSNNIIVTDIMSFNITTQTPVNPPLKPTDATPWHQSDNRDLNKGICGRNSVHATYTCTTTSTNTGQIYYKFCWGDGSESSWLGPYTSGQIVSASHAWTNTSLGNRQITAICKVNDVESTSSPALTVRMYRLGDISANNITGFDDINPFVLMLSSGKNSYYDAFPMGYWFTGDINLDTLVDFADINPFVALLTSG